MHPSPIRIFLRGDVAACPGRRHVNLDVAPGASKRICAHGTCPTGWGNCSYTASVAAEIPDARDGLTRKERVVLWVLSQAESERKGRGVRAAMLYGRVVEHVDMSIEEFMCIVERLSSLSIPLLTRSQKSR
jgi:hypothetical protein